MSIHYSKGKKPELLSPAGNLECFFAAIENGADAVYFGLNDFNARANAQNFSLDEASKAIACARRKSIKVYITLNTLVKNFEMEKVIDILFALEEMQPDSIIIQDLGLLYLIQSRFPGFNLHASTQMSIHNLAGVKQMERLGFKRVVLARELSADEIKHISHNTSLEIEVFVHGALCYSYSGLCLFSSIIGGRSGNRGRCAQPCRMFYKSQSGEAGYLFSMKDLLTLSVIRDLVDAGADSFKIEGRMKSAEYVAVVTNAYRHAIDGEILDQYETINRIKTIFSRETTSAHVMGKNNIKVEKSYDASQVKNADMINPSYPANMGLYAGRVLKSEKNHIVIRAEACIGIRDLLQIFEDASSKPTLLHVKVIRVNGKKVFSIAAGDIANINSDKKILQNAKIYVVSSHKVKETFFQKVPKKLAPARIPVNLEVRIGSGGISISGKLMQFTFNRDYPLKLDKAIHHVIDEEGVKGCFSRLGETPFELANIHTDISDGLFVPLSVLSSIRKDYFNGLFTAWRKEKERRSDKAKKWLKERFITFVNSINRKNILSNLISEDEIRLSVKIDRLDYLNRIPMGKIFKLYIVLTGETIACLQKDHTVVDRLLKEKDRVVFSLPVIMRDMVGVPDSYDYYKKAVNKLMTLGFRQYQISNLGAMGLFDGSDIILYADYPLYSLNQLSIIKLCELGFHRYTLSPEDDRENLLTLISDNTDLIIYQDTLLFISEVCLWANMKSACPGVNRCDFEQMSLQNEYGDRFIAMNEACRTVVMCDRSFSIIHHIPALIEDGHRDFRIDFCHREYSPEMIHDVFSAVQDRRKIEHSITGNINRKLL